MFGEDLYRACFIHGWLEDAKNVDGDIGSPIRMEDKKWVNARPVAPSRLL